MKKLIKLNDPETNKYVGSVVLLTIDWYNDLPDAWDFFTDNIGGTVENFVDWVNSNEEYDLKLDYV